MAKIKSRKHIATTPLVALAASLPLISHAATKEEKVTQLPTIEVNAEQGYKVDKSSSTKYTQPLLDTTQTIQVISKDLLQEQGVATLMEALQNTPGITMQLGENGNTSSGDTFQMRGFSTASQTYVDGIRDLGAITRDTFNLEQIEVIKGGAGSDAGRGSQSGYINLVTKLPKAESTRSTSLTWNTANHKRLTADINQAINDSVAFRLNVMGQEGGIEKRDVLENNGWAIAPSIVFGLDTSTRFYLYGQHIEQNNIPDGGIPTIGMDGYKYVFATPSYSDTTTKPAKTKEETDAVTAALRKDFNDKNTQWINNLNTALNNAPKVNRSNYYGSVEDFEDTTADMFTAKVESELADNILFTNTSRLGKSHIERNLTGTMGFVNPVTLDSKKVTYTYDKNTGVVSNLVNPMVIQAGFDSNNPNTWTSSRSHQAVIQENKILANASNFTINAKTGFIDHDISTGIELAKEEQTAWSTTATGTVPPANLYNPNANDPTSKFTKTGAYTGREQKTASAYLFDTLKFNEQFQVNGGARLDYYDIKQKTISISNNVPSSDIQSTNGNAVSWKVGALYKPMSIGSIYAAFSNSAIPAGSTGTLSTSTTSVDNPNLKTQRTKNYELGTKWDLLNKHLNVNLAAYRTENENQMTWDQDANAGKGDYVSEGKKRVEGVELSAVGQITKNWNVSAGIAHMKTKQLNQFSNSGVESPYVSWSPEWSGTLWTTYNIAGFKVGLGARYMDEQLRSTSATSATTSMSKIPAYTVFDAMAGYTFNKNAAVNLNIYNLADKEYIQTLNSGGNRVKLGTPRSAAITLSYKF